MKKLFLAAGCLFLLPATVAAQIGDDNSLCYSADCEPGIDAMIQNDIQRRYERSLGDILNDMGFGEFHHVPPEELKSCQKLCVQHNNENIGACVSIALEGRDRGETLEESPEHDKLVTRAIEGCQKIFDDDLIRCMSRCNQ